MKTEMEAARDAAWEKESCKGCEACQFEGDGSCDDWARHLFVKAFETGYAARGSQWVAVSERLPDFNVDVLCRGIHFSSNPQMGGGYALITRRIEMPETLTPKEKYVDDNDFRMAYVTHWMPIPPYTADSGQEGE